MGVIGRGGFDGPITAYVPLSAAAASSPTIAITATVVGSANVVHTATTGVYDVLYVYAFNAGASPITAVGQAGSTATTAMLSVSCAAGVITPIVPGLPISGPGAYSVWMSNATGGLSVWGQVARTFAT